MKVNPAVERQTRHVAVLCQEKGLKGPCHDATVQTTISLASSGGRVEFVEVLSAEECKLLLNGLRVDAVLAATTNSSLLSLANQFAAVPIIFLTSPRCKKKWIKEGELAAWDIVSSDEAARLPMTLRNALETSAQRKRAEAITADLDQAKSLLLRNQKSITVGRLLGSIAHEINNPLEAVTNLHFIAQRNASQGHAAYDCIEMAEKELQRVGEITRQMLSFHRESKAPEEISVTSAMETALGLFEVRMRHAAIDVVRQYRNAGCLIAYPGELRQVFSNLIANSLDAMPNGGRLVVRIQERKGVSPTLSITIGDIGTGMSRAVATHVGELFFTTKGETGTGLGMWVTRQLVSKYGGRLRTYSSVRPGKSGTVFRLSFGPPYARIEARASEDHVTQHDGEELSALPWKQTKESAEKPVPINSTDAHENEELAEPHRTRNGATHFEEYPRKNRGEHSSKSKNQDTSPIRHASATA